MFMNEERPALLGRLIAVEGLDGSGKSTQIYLVKKWLESEGVKVFFTEWNSSLAVKKATSKGKKRFLLTPTTFSMVHATDLADRYERQILPLLQAGYIVLSDRYVFTAYVRDVVRGCSPEWVRNLYAFAVRPDITFYFRVPLETALSRILAGRPNLKYFEAGMDLGLSGDIYESFRLFQGKLFDQYERLAKEFNFLTIDADRPIEAQQQQVRRIIADQMDLASYRWLNRRRWPPVRPGASIRQAASGQ
jgi:dTMP kinase